jgi:hypothetical protein
MRTEMQVPQDDWIVSVEALAPEVRGRARFGLVVPQLEDGFGISRPVLTQPDFDLARGDLIDAMLPSTEVTAGGEVGLFVELYGVEAGQSVGVSLM